MRTLVDTSLWSLALRRKAQDLNSQEQVQVRKITELITDDQAVIIGPVRQELLTGIKDRKVFERLRGYLRYFNDEPLITLDYEEAASQRNQCLSVGISGSPVDYLICAVSIRLDLPIFTSDKDFLNYAKHIPISLYSSLS